MLATLVMPLSASAAPGAKHERGMIHLPANITEPVTLQVMDVSVTIPVGAMPKGGPVILKVTKTPDGGIQADFHPERQFNKPVIIKIGDAPIVYYIAKGKTTAIETSDLDGDGKVGEFYSTHFSRYSGFY